MNLYFWLGASAEEADPALVASDQAAPRLAPTGVDPLRCEVCLERFASNNDAYEHWRAHGHDRAKAPERRA